METGHFWKYVDLNRDHVIDNRFVIGSLIACSRDTPRTVDPEVYADIFELQDRIINDILRSHQDQQAAQIAPPTIDPTQQVVATALQSYLNHPSLDRKKVVQAIKFVNRPMLAVQIRQLRVAYTEFQSSPDPQVLLNTVQSIMQEFGATPPGGDHPQPHKPALSREDLHLICFDIVSG